MMMQKISREEADDLIDRWEVVESQVNREPSQLVVQFNLSNHKALRVCYDLQKRVKSYFLADGISSGVGQ